MSYQHILLAVDDSPISYAAVEHTLGLAKLSQSRVTIVSVVSVDPFVGVDFYQIAPAVTDYFMQAEQSAKLRLEDITQSFIRDGIEVQSKIYHGEAAAGILFVADEVAVDLIVMGSHGRTGMKKFLLGSVAQAILTQSHIPVLTIKQ